MTKKEIAEELEKCKEDPYYFYDKYIHFKGDKLSREEFESRMDMISHNQKSLVLKRRGIGPAIAPRIILPPSEMPEWIFDVKIADPSIDNMISSFQQIPERDFSLKELTDSRPVFNIPDFEDKKDLSSQDEKFKFTGERTGTKVSGMSEQRKSQLRKKRKKKKR